MLPDVRFCGVGDIFDLTERGELFGDLSDWLIEHLDQRLRIQRLTRRNLYRPFDVLRELLEKWLFFVGLLVGAKSFAVIVITHLHEFGSFAPAHLH